MKINLKKKVMLAILAGGMLCANGAFADSPVWYGDGGNPTSWKGMSDASDTLTGACTTGANLVLNGEGTYGDIAFADVRYFYGGWSNSTDVTNNTITISGGSYGDDLWFYAGLIVDGTGNANYNNLIIENGTFDGDGINRFYAGSVQEGCEGGVAHNTIEIKGGTFNTLVLLLAVMAGQKILKIIH